MTGWGTHQSFNHLQDHNDFIEGAPWITDNVALTQSTAVAPNGGNADTYGDWNTSQLGTTRRSFTASGSYSRWTYSIYVQKDNDENRFPEFGVDYASEAFRVQLNTKTGVTAQRSSGLAGYENERVSVSDAGDWWLISLSRLAQGSPTIRIFPAITNVFGSVQNGATGSITVAQLTIKEDLHDAWKAANKPRIFSDGAVLIEGARTNALPYSTIDSHYLHTNATSSFALGADGLANSAVILSGTAATIQYIPATGSFVSTSISAFHKADTDKNWRWSYRSGLTVKTPTAATSSAGADWARAQYTLLDFDNRMGWANGSDGNTDPMYLYGMQLETGSYASSYIRTNGSAVTRGAESLSFPAANVPERIRNGKFKFTFWSEFSSDQITGTHNLINFANGNWGISVRASAGVRIAITQLNGSPVSGADRIVTFAKNSPITLTVDTSGQFIIEGCLTGNGTFSIGSFTFPNQDMYIGGTYANTNPFFGVIGQLMRA